MAFYQRLYDMKYSTFHAFVRGLIKDECVAEDIVQNIFMKVWINREKLDCNQSIHNYLYVLARNEIRDYFRRKVNSLHVEIKENTKLFYEDFEGVMDANMMREKIDILIANLPEQRRKVYVMSREDKLSNKEIAEKLDLSVRTVERHIYLVLKEVKKVLPAFVFFIYSTFLK
ncbi:RNA polymerase sigma-70 factor [Marinifilum sp.]|uniref:RNA polymerase sigma-70 factor n=1 Tax=Marinifilum sp. TaxID=2033137 RepID=UPI003BAB31BB